MKKEIFIRVIGSIPLVLVFLFFILETKAVEKFIPPPKSESELKEMMKVTFDQHILPSGANPKVLEQLLERGEVILFNDHPPVVPWMSAAGILIYAPIETVFNTLTDFANYPNFVPMTEKAEMKKVGDNLYDVTFHLKVSVALISYRITYGVYHYNRPPYRTDWAMSSGEFNINSGFWELIPTSDAKATMAFYSVYSEPRSAFLRQIYSREPKLEMLTNVSTATMVVRAIKKEAEKRAGTNLKSISNQPSARKKIQDILSEDPETMKLFLKRGKILVLEDGPTVYVTAGTLVDRESECSYKVVADFSHYPDFVPGVRKVEYLGRGAKGPKYHWEVQMDLVFIDYNHKYDLEYLENFPQGMTFMIDRPCCGPAQGFWQFIPIEQGKKSLIFNGSTVDVRSMGVIVRTALKLEPTLEYALLGSQALLGINSLKDRIQTTCPAPSTKK